MNFKILVVFTVCVAFSYSAPKNSRIRRHFHKEPLFYEPEPVVLVDKPHHFDGYPGFHQGPIIQVVEKGTGGLGGGLGQPPIVVVEQEAPMPIIIADDEPLRLKHVSEPYVVENFNTQYIIDHYQGARIEKFQRLPTVVDHYLPAEVKDIEEGGPITIQLDCAGNPVGHPKGGLHQEVAEVIVKDGEFEGGNYSGHGIIKYC